MMLMCRLSFLSLVKEDRELLFLPSAWRNAGGRDVAGGERGERRGIEVLGGADGGDELAVLVNRGKTIFALASRARRSQTALICLEFLVVHHICGCIRETSS